MGITKIIPDTITSMNLACGVLGVIFTLNERPDTGFLFMLGAAVADFFDGFAARLLHAYSELGKQLDSLCDLVSFGVLPALMLFQVSRDAAFGMPWYVWLPLIFAIATAFRLAKFNIDTRQHLSFIGLPCPAAAMICGSFAYLVTVAPDSFAGCLLGLVWFVPVLAAVLSFLMVSEVPMFAMKFGGDHSDAAATVDGFKRIAFFSITAIAVVVVAILGLSWATVIFASFLSYILINLAFLLVRK